MEKEKTSLTIIIITKNEESEIEECLKSVNFASEILIVDSESIDNTAKIARKLGAKVLVNPFQDFSAQREAGLRQAKSLWVLYIDADERVTAALAHEIKAAIATSEFDAYIIPRKNFFYRKYEWPGTEKMQRLFKKNELLGWYGKVHESPRVGSNKIGSLENPILHYTHKDITTMVEKTNKWSEIESELLLSSNHPQMKEWRFMRIMMTKFIDSFFKQGGWKMGTVGFMESIYQAYSYFIVYAKLWERQKNKVNIK